MGSLCPPVSGESEWAGQVASNLELKVGKSLFYGPKVFGAGRVLVNCIAIFVSGKWKVTSCSHVFNRNAITITFQQEEVWSFKGTNQYFCQATSQYGFLIARRFSQ